MSTLYVVLGAAAGAIITALVTAIAARRRTDAEADHFTAQATDLIVKAAGELVDKQGLTSAKNEAKLEAKINELEGKVDQLSRLVEALAAQLTAAGITPVVSPDSWRR
jgi:outer membrane murein-binding lipoprotein Lpp